jgi:hypothetical protein
MYAKFATATFDTATFPATEETSTKFACKFELVMVEAAPVTRSCFVSIRESNASKFATETFDAAILPSALLITTVLGARFADFTVDAAPSIVVPSFP